MRASQYVSNVSATPGRGAIRWSLVEASNTKMGLTQQSEGIRVF
jgi:hypothetical protein